MHCDDDDYVDYYSGDDSCKEGDEDDYYQEQ